MLYCDNLRTVKMVHDPHSEHKRSKHIDIKYHRIKDEIGEGGVNLQWVRGTENLANIMTKPLARPQFERERSWILRGGEDDRRKERGSISVVTMSC